MGLRATQKKGQGIKLAIVFLERFSVAWHSGQYKIRNLEPDRRHGTFAFVCFAMLL